MELSQRFRLQLKENPCYILVVLCSSPSDNSYMGWYMGGLDICFAPFTL